MSSIAILGTVIVAVITAIGAIVVALVARNSNKMTAGNSAGELALKLAQDADKKVERLEGKVETLEKWQTRVRVAWRDHEVWDDLMLDRLEELSPGTKANMPDRPPLPID